MLTAKQQAFWYPVVESVGDYQQLPTFWKRLTTLDDLPVFRAHLLEQHEAVAQKLGVEVVLVKTTPRYMKLMLGKMDHSQRSVSKVIKSIMALPNFDTNHVYDME